MLYVYVLGVVHVALFVMYTSYYVYFIASNTLYNLHYLYVLVYDLFVLCMGRSHLHRKGTTYHPCTKNTMNNVKNARTCMCLTGIIRVGKDNVLYMYRDHRHVYTRMYSIPVFMYACWRFVQGHVMYVRKGTISLHRTHYVW